MCDGNGSMRVRERGEPLSIEDENGAYERKRVR